MDRFKDFLALAAGCLLLCIVAGCGEKLEPRSELDGGPDLEALEESPPE